MLFNHSLKSQITKTDLMLFKRLWRSPILKEGSHISCYTTVEEHLLGSGSEGSMEISSLIIKTMGLIRVHLEAAMQQHRPSLKARTQGRRFLSAQQKRYRGTVGKQLRSDMLCCPPVLCCGLSIVITHPYQLHLTLQGFAVEGVVVSNMLSFHEPSCHWNCRSLRACIFKLKWLTLPIYVS